MTSSLLMPVVRAIIATILTTSLVGIVLLDELTDAILRSGVVQSDDEVFRKNFLETVAGQGAWAFDPTFLLLIGTIIILVVPDAIAVLMRRRKESHGE